MYRPFIAFIMAFCTRQVTVGLLMINVVACCVHRAFTNEFVSKLLLALFVHMNKNMVYKHSLNIGLNPFNWLSNYEHNT